MCQLSISALGVFDAALDGQSLPPFRTRKSAALLVYLAYEHHAPHPRERLMHLFWPDADTRAAQTNLRQVLYHLRRAVPEVAGVNGAATVPLILADRATLQLNADADVLFDVLRFRDLLQQVRRHGHDDDWACVACRNRLRAAEHLYRGEFMADLQLEESAPFSDWSRQVRETLRADFLETLRRLVDLALAEGDLAAAQRRARRLLHEDELYEPGHRQLMRILARQGLRNDALNQYAACRRLLAQEMGLEPAAETALLAQEIAEGQAYGETLTPVQSRLPAPLTPFFGRQAELVELLTLLDRQEARLVEIIGPGGVGKTRLALAFLQQVASRFEHGVFRVPLVGVADTPAGLHGAIAEAVGLSLTSDRSTPAPTTRPLEERLLDYLSARQMLILLDNFESVLTQAPELLRLLRRAPDVTLLVTSREKIPISGAFNLRLDGLAYPSRDDSLESLDCFPAVQLFLHAARSAGLAPRHDGETRRHVAELCRLLRGQPLALELAAEWADTLPPEALLAEIRRSYRVLAVDRVDLEPRHRSMLTVFEATWSRLSSAEQSFFRRLCIFRGGFSREAAAEVAAIQESPREMLRLLAGLVDKSLISYQPREDRYAIHELLRQFGADRLDQKRALRFQLENRHASYFAEWLDKQWLRLRGAESAAAQKAIDREFPNVRYAWTWAAEQGALWILNRLAHPLGWYLLWRGRHQEGIEMYAAAAARVVETSAPPVRQQRLLALLWTWEAALRVEVGQVQNSMELFRRSREMLAQAGQPDATLQVFLDLQSGRQIFEQDRDAARDHFLRALALAEGFEDPWFAAHCHYWLGRVYHSQADIQQAEMALQKALHLWQETNDMQHQAESLVWIGFNALRRGNLEATTRFMERAEALWLEAGNRVASAVITRHRAPVYFWRGDMETARRLCNEALPDLQRAGLRHHVAFVEVSEAVCAFYQAKLAEARDLGLRALATARETHMAREELLALFALGGAALAMGDTVRARQQLEEGVRVGRDGGVREEVFFCTSHLGLLDLQEGRRDDARRKVLQMVDHIVEQRAYFVLVVTTPLLTAVFLDAGDVTSARDAWQLSAQLPTLDQWPLKERFVEAPLRQALDAAADLDGPRSIEGIVEAGRQVDPYVILSRLRARLKDLPG